MNDDTYSCVICNGDIRTPWDGELATSEEVHTCSHCEYPVCWDCKEMDVNGIDWCQSCCADAQKNDPALFDHFNQSNI